MTTTRSDRSAARTTSRSGSGLRSRCAGTAASSGSPPPDRSLRASRLPEARATRCRISARSVEPSRPGRPSWPGSPISSRTIQKRWSPTPSGTSSWGSGTRWFNWPRLRRWDRARWTRPGCRDRSRKWWRHERGKRIHRLLRQDVEKNKIPLSFFFNYHDDTFSIDNFIVGIVCFRSFFITVIIRHSVAKSRSYNNILE